MTAILGGGISGLSAAYYCLENSKIGSVALYESSKHLGGWIKSITTPSGVIFEKGPRTIRLGNKAAQNTLMLIEKLNLNSKIIPIKWNHPAYSNRLIYANETLHVLPNNVTNLFKIQEPFNRRLISIAWNEVRVPKEINEDESIYSFTERRLGKDVADFLISPLISGICAGNAKEISVKFLMKNGFEYEQKYGSITKGIVLNLMRHLLSNFKTNSHKEKELTTDLINRAKVEKWFAWGLHGGLEQLPIALKNNLNSNSNIKIYKNTPCEQLTFKPGVAELLTNGKVEKYCKVISSISAKSLAPLLEKQHPQLAQEIKTIPFVTVAVVNLRYSENILPLEAFGLLVPPNENLPILGIVFDSSIFKKDSSTVLTVMMGGVWFDKYFGDNPTNEHFLSTAVNQTKSILNMKKDPVEYDVTVLKDCIPQYVVGHYQKVQRIQNYISAHKIPLALCGSSFDGIGLNDVILSAKKAVSHIA
ncbi:PREDICTED: protoporphyrinogen oxidase [Ceratosolen solmsi marchali]|uniref:Protoporphyrinogen oxidase n=1 Tax=Ceratosolen solmsi marchali TaxID=326594 RepID=A0AAJ6YW52_9HYME|nr:PREDICTED: protoporphyrinogen oxidase [Ceratosolen solmsi marchali]